MLDLITLFNVHVRIWASILHQVMHMIISEHSTVSLTSHVHRNAFWDSFSAVFLIETNQGILEDRIMLLPTFSSSFCVIRSPMMCKIGSSVCFGSFSLLLH